MKKNSKKRKWLRWFLWGSGAMLLFVSLLLYFLLLFPIWGIPFNGSRHTQVPVTPSWALECWLWEDDHNTAAFVDELLAGYRQHDLPVRTLLIDSPWSMRYNDFTVDQARYPEPEKWLRSLDDQGYRVVLWMTSMVNSHSKDTAVRDSSDWFAHAKTNGYLAGNGLNVKWWKGSGGFIDYTNPKAMKWWHGLQDQVLDLGIDGWKLDGTATFFSSRLGRWPFPYQKTYAGWMTLRGYMDHYYRDEYAYGLSRNPEFVTLSRSIDQPYTHPEGFAPLDAAPVTWVGDQDHTWKSDQDQSRDRARDDDLAHNGAEGIEEALRDILHAAELGYCVIGSDIGGYGGASIPPRLYIRWAQFSTFCGLFLNGGHGERRLWHRTMQELEIIRKFSWLHTELVPYMYSHVVQCAGRGKPLQRPVRGKYHYLFSDDLLIAPIYQDSPQSEVQLPEGKWRYWFQDDQIVQGPVAFAKDFPLDEYPVYVREGAIIPMHISRAYTGIGEADWEGYLTLNVYPAGIEDFLVHHADLSGTMRISVAETDERITVELSGIVKPHILRIYLDEQPLRILRDGAELDPSGEWQYLAGKSRLLVRSDNEKSVKYQIDLQR